MSAPLRDSNGDDIRTGRSYRIRLPTGQEIGFRTNNPRRWSVGLPGSGAFISINPANGENVWRDAAKAFFQGRFDDGGANPTALRYGTIGDISEGGETVRGLIWETNSAAALGFVAKQLRGNSVALFAVNPAEVARGLITVRSDGHYPWIRVDRTGLEAGLEVQFVPVVGRNEL